ncbi:Com family DNA-binding transcriptional regulator [Desulfofundulus salinus]|uniref:Com family DNA-binding transcriptional regulator n=1 Tax=Desulfofundulus salinus TaxID=2419843 RepID=A0A494WW43_9FIRM|nr:Com family DNA-binding transcriptional regulator [Desulfofundulus salinum]
MADLRCPKCGKLLLKFQVHGSITLIVKCPRCKNLCSLSMEVRGETRDTTGQG